MNPPQKPCFHLRRNETNCANTKKPRFVRFCWNRRRQWREGQRAKARCGSLERLLVEAYELINMAKLQHVRLNLSELLVALYGTSV